MIKAKAMLDNPENSVPLNVEKAFNEIKRMLKKKENPRERIQENIEFSNPDFLNDFIIELGIDEHGSFVSLSDYAPQDHISEDNFLALREEQKKIMEENAAIRQKQFEEGRRDLTFQLSSNQMIHDKVHFFLQRISPLVYLQRNIYEDVV
ncbi:uncharacterized protein MONOS_17753 [Monocercomonoides exilis]|uniref:uncharacterized protein n=1 Tax=Monocercomonoides exilis TaxID=2049356 RepID=UPI003559E5F0|nr:hypothetical protein MONOS_17753 [Monocercomonoides exilis]